MNEFMKTQKPKKLKQVSQATITEIFTRFEKISPEPKGELNYVNPFTLLVAVVLSAQATDVGVNKATKALFEVADTPQKMLALGEDALRDYIKTIGLFRAKAKNVILLCEKLMNDYEAQVPQTCDELITLAGVGRKTANVVLNMAFGHKTMAVDTHVFRVSNRIPLSIGTTPEQIEEGLLKRIPTQFMMHAHHWLILHGRYICKARKPECEICPISDLCQSKVSPL
jgi:endonuclease III